MPLSESADRLAASLRAAFLFHHPDHIGVAVSGGGDSVALLHLTVDWARQEGARVSVVTVDHGLRKEAAAEAAFVADLCRALRVPHSIVKWEGWQGTGNLQDQARRARQKLIAGWATTTGVRSVALGHTADDQAETFLLRLARGSGVDGLSAMAAHRRSGGIAWLRPLLEHRREELRDFLKERGIGWIEDPSNQDQRFDRVKMRRALEVLAPLGIDVPAIAETTARLRSARRALEVQTQIAAQNMAHIQAGDVVYDRRELGRLPGEIRMRLLNHALCWVGSSDYRPRASALIDIEIGILDGRSATLHGCRILVAQDDIRITRELQAVRDTRCDPAQVWDRRWRVSGRFSRDLELRALGESGIVHCPDWRATGLPRASLLATPAVWRDDVLVAAPLAGMANGWKAELLRGAGHFFSSILSH